MDGTKISVFFFKDPASRPPEALPWVEHNRRGWDKYPRRWDKDLRVFIKDLKKKKHGNRVAGQNTRSSLSHPRRSLLNQWKG